MHISLSNKAQANPLLQREDVGRAKPSTHLLPQEGFTFGKIEYRDGEGAGARKLLFHFILNSHRTLEIP